MPMKGHVLYGVGDLRYEEGLDRPVPREGEALVRVRAAGICGSDIPRIYKTGAHRHPLVPGHEFSGEVAEAAGAGGSAWEGLVGRRVAVYPLIPCGTCPKCRKGWFELCDHYDYLGSRCDGGFAEYARVPLWNLMPIPDTLSFAAAAMMEPMSVAVHAMRFGGFGAGERAGRSVCVFGLGTIGLLLAMFLREAGVSQLFLLGNKEIQREKSALLGIAGEDFCDTRSVDAAEWLMEKTGGQGVDVFYDCVGKEEGILLGLRCTAAMGQMVSVGNPASDMHIPKELYWRLLRQQIRIQGIWNSSYRREQGDDWHYAMERLLSGRICPESLISHRVPFAHLAEGLRIMRDKTEGYVKIMAFC